MWLMVLEFDMFDAGSPGAACRAYLKGFLQLFQRVDLNLLSDSHILSALHTDLTLSQNHIQTQSDGLGMEPRKGMMKLSTCLP